MASLNPNLKDFWVDQNLNPIAARVRVLYGGRSSSKSWEYAGRVSWIGQKYKTRVLCVRRFQNKIKESVYTLIKNQIENFGFGDYRALATSIVHKNGTEMVFYGIERNIEEIKSFEGADILWIEEAQNLTKEQWEILEPTIRKEGSEIWVSFNPREVTDFSWKHFVLKPPKGSIVRKINYPDNPFLSKTMIDVINNLKQSDYDAYKHVYLGEPRQDGEGVIIRREWLDSALIYKGKSGAKVIGYDVADSGDDANSYTEMDGNIVDNIVTWQAKEDELNKSAMKVLHRARELDAVTGYDSIGVGAHTGSTLNANNFKNHYKYNAGGKVRKPKARYKGIKNGEFFSNLKAQSWWDVADRFRNTHIHVTTGEKFKHEEMISINPKCDNLEALMVQLSTVKKDYDKLGRVKVESKDDLKARQIESPNEAEGFVIAASRHLVGKTKISTVNIEGL